MKNLDDWIDQVRSVMQLAPIDPPVLDAIRVHPDDMKELRRLSEPVTGSVNHWPSGWGFQRYVLDGLPVIEDPDAERLPRKG